MSRIPAPPSKAQGNDRLSGAIGLVVVLLGAVATLGQQGEMGTVSGATSPASVTRPFPAPVTKRTVKVPSRIDATGTSDVTKALQAFVNSVPNGSIISFPTNAVYRVSLGIRLDGRSNLVFDGNGTTIRSTGSGNNVLSSPFALTDRSTDLWIREFILEGSNPRTGAAIYEGSLESQMGVAIYGNTRIEISNTTIKKTHGDAIYTNETGSTHAWPTDIWVHHNTFDTIGRNAFTINSGRRVTLENNTITRVGASVLDIEPDTDYQGAVDLLLRDNTIGSWGLSPDFTMHFVVAANGSSGPGALVDGVTVTGNHVSEGAPYSANNPNSPGLKTNLGRPARMYRILFANNTTSKAGIGPALYFNNISGLTLQGNVQPLTSGSLFSISNSTGVVTP